MSEAITFTCNVCGRASTVDRSRLVRENQSCRSCSSTVRYRSIVRALSIALFGESLTLARFPSRRDLTGAGLSDWSGYAERLARKFDYRNTYYHSQPRLDITDVPPEWHHSLDFLIATEVFEHVEPPIDRAFSSSFAVLKQGGWLVLTLPYNASDGDTIEFFPDLHDWKVLDFVGGAVLVNRTVEGRWQVFDKITMHEGVGETLAMREFTRGSVRRSLEDAGFDEIREVADDDEKHGVIWLEECGRPFLARRRSE